MDVLTLSWFYNYMYVRTEYSIFGWDGSRLEIKALYMDYVIPRDKNVVQCCFMSPAPKIFGAGDTLFSGVSVRE